MTKKIKLASALGAMVAIAAPLATMACGSDKASDKDTTLFLVTDKGDVNDKSFNEQAFKAIQNIKGVSSTVADKFVIKPTGDTSAEMLTAYENAQSAGAKTVIAAGFAHSFGIPAYNTQLGSGEKVNFISIDYSLEDETTKKNPANVASITFDTKYAGYKAGMLSAKYLKAKGDTTPTLGTFGGDIDPAVTDFMVGYIYGAYAFNNSTEADAGKKVKFAQHSSDAGWVGSGFTPGDGIDEAANLLNGGADVIFPVAGPQTADVITKITTTSGSTTKVIGVDVNQAEVFTENKNLFITSVEKNVKKAVEDIYTVIKGGTVSGINGLGKANSIGSMTNGYVGISNNTASGMGWDGVTTASTIFSGVDALTMTNIDTALQAISGFGGTTKLSDKTWADALAIAKSMTSHS